MKFIAGIPADNRARICQIEQAIKDTPGSLGKDPFPLKHNFAPGLYAREITVPAGMLIATQLHQTEHFIFMLKGEVSIFSEEGISRVVGPVMLRSPFGAKRIVYTHQETVWINVHSNPENITDLERLEEKYIAHNYEELALHEGGQKCLG